MNLGTKEGIPAQISADLDSRYTTDYHLNEWTFNLLRLNPLEAWVVGDVEKMFKVSQRWKAEAVSVSLARFHIVLHTEGKPPAKRELFIKPPTIRTQLDLSQVLKDGIGQAAEVQHHGLRRDLFIDTEIPQLGPFGTREDLERAKTPYFIRRIGLRPFYYYQDNRFIMGEDPSRVFLAVDLEDGRETTQNTVDSKLDEHQKQLTAAGTAYFRQKLHYESLQSVTDEEIVGKERAFLRNLNARPDPFNKPLL